MQSQPTTQILRALLHGPLDHFQIAADVVAPAFIVHAKLVELKRERFVRERIGDPPLWELTRRGKHVTSSAEQTSPGQPPLVETRAAIRVALAPVAEGHGALCCWRAQIGTTGPREAHDAIHFSALNLTLSG